jgi:hypothetical protein
VPATGQPAWRKVTIFFITQAFPPVKTTPLAALARRAGTAGWDERKISIIIWSVNPFEVTLQRKKATSINILFQWI